VTDAATKQPAESLQPSVGEQQQSPYRNADKTGEVWPGGKPFTRFGPLAETLRRVPHRCYASTTNLARLSFDVDAMMDRSTKRSE
jgi:hypothetical protein